MPTISVAKDFLGELLGYELDDKKFDELCFEFGIELDDVEIEGGRTVYKIDIPANRYDLLSAEGLAQSLRAFEDNHYKLPSLELVAPEAGPISITVKAEANKIRPFVVCAILRGVSFTSDSYASFIDAQTKLHNNLGRRRNLVSIGTHDMSAVQVPFTYTARRPEDIRFLPLYGDEPVDGHGLMAQLSAHKQLAEFLPLIRDSPVYPVIEDAAGRVMSLPPIINSAFSKMSIDTKDIFIEVTARDITRAHSVLDVLVQTFAMYCARPFSVEPVRVVYEACPAILAKQLGATPGGRAEQLCPAGRSRSFALSIDYAESYLGVEFSRAEAVRCLARMGLAVADGPADVAMDEAVPAPSDPARLLTVVVPPTRTDVLHAVDLVEDIGIGFGYNELPAALPPTPTIGALLPKNVATDALRAQIAHAGYTEVLCFGLCAIEDLTTRLRRGRDAAVVELANPKTKAFSVVRTTLLPGLLKTVAANKDRPLPLRFFEVSDVVRAAETDTGAANTRLIGAVQCGMTDGFEHLRGLLDFVAMKLGIAAADISVAACDAPEFLPRRGVAVSVTVGGARRPFGRLGVVHPEVLAAFGITFPCSALELELAALG